MPTATQPTIGMVSLVALPTDTAHQRITILVLKNDSPEVYKHGGFVISGFPGPWNHVIMSNQRLDNIRVQYLCIFEVVFKCASRHRFTRIFLIGMQKERHFCAV